MELTIIETIILIFFALILITLLALVIWCACKMSSDIDNEERKK